MTSIRTYTSRALVLKYFPYKEADLIVTLFAKNHGKVQVIARGARKLKSKFSGHLEPLTIVDIQLAKGKSLETVTQVQTFRAYPSLFTDLAKLAQGIYISELIDQFTPDKEPNAQIFNIALDTLDSISSFPSSELSMRNFEFQILKLSGFLPELFNCLKCGIDIKPDDHRYSVYNGGTMCTNCSDLSNTLDLSLPTIKTLRHFYRHPSIGNVELKIKKNTYLELKNLLLATIIFWLEKDLKSTHFIEHLKNLETPLFQHNLIQ